MKTRLLSPRVRDNISYCLFLLPAALFLLLIILYPMFDSLILSFQSWDGSLKGARTWVGLANYIQLFTKDHIFQLCFKNNFIYTAVFLFGVNFVCLVIALLLNQALRLRNLFRTIIYFPQTVAGVAIGTIWVWMFNMKYGLINEILRSIGLGSWAIDWLGKPGTAFGGIIVTGAWQAIGGGIIFFLAGLQTIPGDVYDAAKTDGASVFQTLFRITIPLLKETFVIVMTLTLIGSMKVFDIIFSLTAAGPARQTNVLGTWMYYQSFVFGHFDLGAAIAWVLVALIAIFAIPYVLLMSRNSTY